MDPLANPLAQLTTPTPPSVSTAEVALERLAELPPTAHVQAELAERRADLARLGAVVQRTTAEKAQFLIRALEERLALCERRDALQAERPPGCWCLGLGGRGARYYPALDDAEFPERVWDQYCVCPDAEQARAR